MKTNSRICNRCYTKYDSDRLDKIRPDRIERRRQALFLQQNPICSDCKTPLVREVNWQKHRSEVHHYICNKCYSIKAHDYYVENDEEIRLRTKLWYSNNPEQARKHNQKITHRKKLEKFERYGLSEIQYNEMIERGCQACHEAFDFSRRYLEPAIDHDHEAENNYGKLIFRGLIHHRCNLILTEAVCANPQILIRATGYLEKLSYNVTYDQNAHVTTRTLSLKRHANLKLVEEILAKQGGSCAICELQFSMTTIKNGYGSYQRLNYARDHNMKTGLIRGLLCAPCNILIGIAQENQELLTALFDYITKFKGASEMVVLCDTRSRYPIGFAIQKHRSAQVDCHR